MITKFQDMSKDEFEHWLKTKGVCNPDFDEPIDCSIVQMLLDFALNEQWISVKDEIPDKGLRVLMQLNNAWEIVGWYDIEDDQWFEVMHAEPVANDRVLAWMPIPEWDGDER